MGTYGNILIYPKVAAPLVSRGFPGVFRRKPPPVSWAYPLGEPPAAIGLEILRAMERTELFVDGTADSLVGKCTPMRGDHYGYFQENGASFDSWVQYRVPASSLHRRMDRLVVTLTQRQMYADWDDEPPPDDDPPTHPRVDVFVGTTLAKLGPDGFFRAADRVVSRDSVQDEIEASTFAIIDIDHEAKLDPAIHRLKDSRHPVFEELQRVFGLPVECSVLAG